MKKSTIALGMAALTLSAAFALAGCGSKKTTITITGSSSVSPVMNQLAAAYMETNKNVKILVQTSDSSSGISDTIDGKNDFGMASRDLKSSETGATAKQIAIDGVAIVVNNSSTLTNVTADELYNLYANGTAIGDITVPYSRESGSGTRDAFDDLIKNSEGKKLKELSALASVVATANNTGEVMTAVASNAKALGYISMGSIDSTVKVIQFEGVDATVANVKAGTYKLSRPFNIVLSDSRELSAEAQAFVDYIMSDAAQAVIERQGCISIK